MATERSQYDQCLLEGKYERIGAGETCTIETAKKLGIFAKDKYLDPAYKEVQTFNSAFDKGRTVTAKLCSINADDSKAYTACQIEYGPMFAPINGTPNTCAVYECPPGFTRTDMTTCRKPKDTFLEQKKKFCSERFYDWYTIPNYHLGNGYSREGSECYAPCPGEQVPFRKKDPVNNYRSTLSDDPDQLHRCIHKQYYMSGRYKNTPQYSPLAWIKRLNTTARDLLEDWTEALEKEKIDPSDPYLQKRLKPHADEVYRTQLLEQIPGTMEDLYKPGEYYKEVAKFQLESDQFGYQKKALAICKQLRDEREIFLMDYRQKFPDIGDKEFDLRIKLLEQACHLCFCETEKQCFKFKSFLKKEDVKELNSEARTTGSGNQDTSGNEFTGGGVDASETVEKQLFYPLRIALGVFLLIVIVPPLIYTIYLLIKFIIKRRKKGPMDLVPGVFRELKKVK